MRAGGPSFKLVAGNALLVGLALVAFVAVLSAERGVQAVSVWTLTTAATLAGIAVIAGLLTAMWTDRVRYRSLRKLVAAARRISDGELTPPVRISGPQELAALARFLNTMQERLLLHARTIDRQQRTQESVLSQLHEGVVVTRGDGRISLLNPAAVRLLNLPIRMAGDESALVGQAVERCIPQHDLQMMLHRRNPAEREARSADSGIVEGRGRADVIEEARIQIDSVDGIVHLLARASDVVFPAGDAGSDQPALGRLLVLTDITELARTLQMRTDFVGNASHELRTPLSTIRAAVETLLQLNFVSEPDAAQRFLSVIDRQSARLVAIVADLLELARLESPALRLEPQPLDVAAELREIEVRFAEAIRAKRLRWAVDAAAPARSIVLANPQLLRLVLDNLVDNAIKFTEPGGEVRLGYSLAVSGEVDEDAEGSIANLAVFEVSDTGCGISEAEQERVFERFYQVEKARSGHERGTGLGLAIVRHAVAAMGGSVSLDSKPGQGTRVTVQIPQSR